MWWAEGNVYVLKLSKSVGKWSKAKWSEVKWRVVQWRGVNRGVTWRVLMGGKMKWSDGHVKIGVQYLKSNNIRN
jgi:hypothetical protein